jgi:hypothetical protein
MGRGREGREREMERVGAGWAKGREGREERSLVTVS